MPNEKKTKILFKVEFWRENQEKDPVATRYIRAWSQKSAYMSLKERALIEARQYGKHLLLHLLGSEDVRATFEPIEDRREKLQKKEKQMLPKYRCRKCGSELDDDYCQECGWRRQASWIDVAVEKKAIAQPS